MRFAGWSRRLFVALILGGLGGRGWLCLGAWLVPYAASGQCQLA